MSDELYECPCCGHRTLGEKPPGTFAICQVCFWEDDSVQFDDPEYRGGANRVSLNEAKMNFKQFGACELEMREFVRAPREGEE